MTDEDDGSLDGVDASPSSIYRKGGELGQLFWGQKFTMLAIRVWFFNTRVLTLLLVTAACTDAMHIKTSHHVATSLTRRRHDALYNAKNPII